MRYLAAAEQTGEWLLSTAERGPNRSYRGVRGVVPPEEQSWHWPGQPGVSGEFAPGLGWGTAGPALFFTEAFRTTGDERWLAAAKGGARWMAANLDATADAEAGCGLFTGIGGWAVVLHELADAAGDCEAADLAGRVLRTIAAKASVSASGVNWHDLTEILWGTAGIGCLLLTLGPAYLGSAAVELAAGAGDWLLAQAEDAPRGIRWSLGAGAYTEPGIDPRVRFPNFAHGAAGISFFLARLAAQTGDERYLEASLAGTEWIMTTARTDDDTCAAYHHEPDATDLFTLGWCHGPPGLGWLFRQLELSTGDPGWRTWLRRAARADLTSGIPVRKEPGFWDNVARCCGSAGVAEFFLDLYRLEGEPADLEFARLLVDDLLGRAIADDAGTRWSNHEYRAAAPDLPPETTYLQGAPGIGSTLLRLHRVLAGDPWQVRWPHAPCWDEPA
jgi:lantibiotic modifying enzyme